MFKKIADAMTFAEINDLWSIELERTKHLGEDERMVALIDARTRYERLVSNLGLSPIRMGGWVLVREHDLTTVAHGTQVVMHEDRGKKRHKATFCVGGEPPHKPSSSGRIRIAGRDYRRTQESMTYFPNVAGCFWWRPDAEKYWEAEGWSFSVAL